MALGKLLWELMPAPMGGGQSYSKKMIIRTSTVVTMNGNFGIRHRREITQDSVSAMDR